MYGKKARLLILIVLGLLLFAGAEGTTVVINVFESKNNLTPIPQALVFADTIMIGKTDEGGSVEFSHPGTASMDIRVTKKGFDEWTGLLGANATTLLVEMNRKNLTLQANVFDADTLGPVSGARITLSGEGVTKSAVTDANGTAAFPVKTSDVYDLSIDAPNYQSRSALVEMGVDNRLVQYWLFRDDRFALVVKDETSQQPLAGAQVYFDGVLKGTTDQRGALTIDLPRNKVYMIKVRAEGYQDYIEKRIIGQDEALVTLLLAKTPYRASVSVYDESKVPVEGADIYMGGQLLGSTNQYGRIVLDNLTVGEYPLFVSHAGFVSSNTSLGVTSLTDEIVIVLGYEKANLTITTTEADHAPVQGVWIMLNGIDAGRTDEDGTLRTKLRVNYSYALNATKDGYNPATVRTKVNSTADTALTITMNKSMNWLLIGSIIFIIGAIIAAFVLMRSRTSSHHSRHGKGGL